MGPPMSEPNIDHAPQILPPEMQTTSGVKQELYYPFDVEENPMSAGGHRERTHRLVKPDPDTLIIEPLFKPKAQIWGELALAIGLWALVPLSVILEPGAIGKHLFVAAFFGFAGWLLWNDANKRLSALKTFHFDRRRQACMVLNQKQTRSRSGRQLGFADISGIQLLGEDAGDDDGTYRSFEMSLVLTEPQGERLLLMDHAEWVEFMEDAETLSFFIDLPLYNACFSSRSRPKAPATGETTDGATAEATAAGPPP